MPSSLGYGLRQYLLICHYIAQHDITTGNGGCRKIARPHVAEQGQDIPISFTLNSFLIVEHSETFHCGQTVVTLIFSYRIPGLDTG